MKKKILILNLVGFFLFSVTTLAEEPLVLTLEKSVQLALIKNPQQQAAQERLKAAQSMVREAAAQFFPSLNAQGMHTLDEKAMELEFPSLVPGLPPRRVEIDFTRDYQFSISLNLPLFTSGRLTSNFKQAQYNLKATKESVRQTRQETIYNTKRAFYGYLLAKEFVQVAEEAVVVAQKHYQKVKALYEVGLASKFDLLRSEVQLANLKPQLIRARNNLKIAELSLKTILGLDLKTPIQIKGELRYRPFKVDEEECFRQALQNRPELLQLNFQKQRTAEMVKLARASGLPTVAVAGNFNYWADRFNFKKDTWSNYYSVNLVVTIPLFNGFATSARVAQSKAVLRELEKTREGLINMIRFEVSQALLRLKEAEESLLSQEKNVEQAQESLRIAELNYAEGLATTLDVSSAQAALSQAKTNYSQALYDYVMAQAALEKAIGVSLGGK
jgi:outer membrane protein TolC